MSSGYYGKVERKSSEKEQIFWCGIHGKSAGNTGNYIYIVNFE